MRLQAVRSNKSEGGMTHRLLLIHVQGSTQAKAHIQPLIVGTEEFNDGREEKKCKGLSNRNKIGDKKGKENK